MPTPEVRANRSPGRNDTTEPTVCRASPNGGSASRPSRVPASLRASTVSGARRRRSREQPIRVRDVGFPRRFRNRSARPRGEGAVGGSLGLRRHRDGASEAPCAATGQRDARGRRWLPRRPAFSTSPPIHAARRASRRERREANPERKREMRGSRFSLERRDLVVPPPRQGLSYDSRKARQARVSGRRRMRRRASFSIWRMRSRETEKRMPISASVRSPPPSSP